MARPKGSKDTKPRRTAARKMAEAPPLPFVPEAMATPSADRPDLPMHEMMREIARRRWFAGDENGALYAAEKAAPYFAARLSATTATVAHSFDTNGLTDSDLARELAAAREALPGFAGRDEEADDPPVTH